MADLAQRAMEAVEPKDGSDPRVKFHPERYARGYLDWLSQKRDWCISRQLWWGHRIPIWSCPTATEVDLEKAFGGPCSRENLSLQGGREGIAWRADETRGGFLVCARDEDLAADAIPGHRLEQDPDVLDTWFSSALWPFSTLGWPKKTKDLKTFYPTDVLVTAREIITLWVARMVMVGLYALGEVPFRDVYIHAMIQDGEGRPMKKSLGNGVDPLDIVATHGADALRFTLAYMTTETQDVRLPVRKDAATGRNTSPKFDMGRNFCNKLWNAVRFALMNLEGADRAKFDKKQLRLEDLWILSRSEQTLRALDMRLESFGFQSSLMALYDFFWGDLCDWYLEAVKPRLADASERPTAQRILAFVVDRALRMLHPFVPFITEAAWEDLNGMLRDRSLAGLADAPLSERLIAAPWPLCADALADERAETDFAAVMDVVRAVRNIRNKMQIAPSARPAALVRTEADRAAVLAAAEGLVQRLTGVERLTAGPEVGKAPHSATEVVAGAEVYVPLEGLIDLEAERKRLEDRIGKERAFLAGIEKKLANPKFVECAPAEVVERERARADEVRATIAALEKNLAGLA
jgi:valyl-tRNA synthetase